MKKAVIILAHNLPEQLDILIDQILFDDDFDVFLHINKKYDIEILKKIKRRDRLFIAKNNIEICWGDDQVLKAILIMFQNVIDSNVQYGSVFLMSGQDLVIKKGLSQFLDEHENCIYLDALSLDKNFIKKYALSRLLFKWPKIYKKKYDFRYNPIRIARSLKQRIHMHGIGFKKKVKKEVYNNLLFYKDFYHFVIQMDVVKYFVEVSNNHDYMKLFYGGFLPEELFFSTTIMNSRFRERVQLKNNLFETISYRHLEYQDHPRILTMDDAKILENGGCFIARKFNIDVDKEIIDYFYKLITGGKNESCNISWWTWN